MARFIIALLCLFIILLTAEAAKILAVYPTPSISHQIPLRPLTHELARRGHDVTVITTDPAFPKGKAPANLTEIDVHDMSYKIWQDIMSSSSNTDQDLELQIKVVVKTEALVFEKQLKSPAVKEIINGEKDYDLLLLEAWVRPALVFTHIFKAPVILVSSLGSLFETHSIMGSAMHPFLYPETLSQRIYNLTLLEKISEFYNQYVYHDVYVKNEELENEIIRRNIGSHVPRLSELKNNVDMTFFNVYPIWDENRPVPPNVVYVGGIHEIPEMDLPADLKSYLDFSNNGAIYVSFGTNIRPSMLPKDRIQVFLNVFAKLPYNVLWKWDTEELPEKTENIKISKWFPQPDLLRHKNIKLFITQGGLQSTDEAIRAGVPLIGVPFFADQWYNSEKYKRHEIGTKLDIATLTEDVLLESITRIIGDESYRRNVIKLRTLMYDQPQRPLERAVWWTEHVLRHGGAKHLRAPTANLPWTEYFELKLIALLLSIILALLLAVFLILKVVIKSVFEMFTFRAKIKKS